MVGLEQENSRGETALHAFARKNAACNDTEYSVDEAEGRDFIYVLQNSCMQCSKSLRSSDVKVIPSRYIQERDAYVRTGIVYRRYMCVPCYNILRKSSIRVRAKAPVSMQYRSVRARFIRNVLNEFLAGNQEKAANSSIET